MLSAKHQPESTFTLDHKTCTSDQAELLVLSLFKDFKTNSSYKEQLLAAMCIETIVKDRKQSPIELGLNPNQCVEIARFVTTHQIVLDSKKNPVQKPESEHIIAFAQ